MKSFDALKICSLILAAMLAVSPAPLPYGYYTLLRIAVAVIAACWAYRYFSSGKPAPGVFAVAILLLFQPFVRLHLDRLTWNIADIALAVLLIVISLKRK